MYKNMLPHDCHAQNMTGQSNRQDHLHASYHSPMTRALHARASRMRSALRRSLRTRSTLLSNGRPTSHSMSWWD